MAAASHGAFPAPPELRPAVSFWSTLFVRYDGTLQLLHDRDNLNIVWEVVSLPTNPRTRAVEETQARALSRRKVDELKERMLRLAQDPSPQDPLDIEILNNVRLHLPGDTKTALLQSAERIRSQRGVADSFQQGLKRCQPYLKDMRRIMRQERVPEEVALLPFVESMFNTKARSAVGASGIWQLMPATARGLGLKVGRKRDDRHNVLKATRAAARMLRQNHTLLGSWPLAITAYNHGPNGVRRAMVQVGSDDLVTLIKTYEQPTWGFSSKNFYAEFLAVLSLVNYRHPATTPAVASARLRPNAAP